MNRREDILDAATNYSINECRFTGDRVQISQIFEKGAEWADANHSSEVKDTIREFCLRLGSAETRLNIALEVLGRFDRNIAERHEATTALLNIIEIEKTYSLELEKK